MHANIYSKYSPPLDERNFKSDPPQIAKLLSGGQHKLNFFCHKK